MLFSKIFPANSISSNLLEISRLTTYAYRKHTSCPPSFTFPLWNTFTDKNVTLNLYIHPELIDHRPRYVYLLTSTKALLPCLFLATLVALSPMLGIGAIPLHVPCNHIPLRAYHLSQAYSLHVMHLA